LYYWKSGVFVSLGYPTVKVSIATRRQHWRIDKEEKRAPIPQLIWNDGHTEWSRWYWFKDNSDRMGRGYCCGFK